MPAVPRSRARAATGGARPVLNRRSLRGSLRSVRGFWRGSGGIVKLEGFQRKSLKPLDDGESPRYSTSNDG